MGDDDEAEERVIRAVEVRIERLLQGVISSREEEPVLRLSQKELERLLALESKYSAAMWGGEDGSPGILTRLQTHNDTIEDHRRVLHGASPEKAADGIVHKVAVMGDRVSTWVRVTWLVGGATLTALIKLLIDSWG